MSREIKMTLFKTVPMAIGIALLYFLWNPPVGTAKQLIFSVAMLITTPLGIWALLEGHKYTLGNLAVKNIRRGLSKWVYLTCLPLVVLTVIFGINSVILSVVTYLMLVGFSFEVLRRIEQAPRLGSKKGLDVG